MDVTKCMAQRNTVNLFTFTQFERSRDTSSELCTESHKSSPPIHIFILTLSRFPLVIILNSQIIPSVQDFQSTRRLADIVNKLWARGSTKK
jgi:hypothetical protein